MAQRVAITGLGSLWTRRKSGCTFAGLLAGQTAVRHLPALVKGRRFLSVRSFLHRFQMKTTATAAPSLSGQPQAGLLLHSAQFALRQQGLADRALATDGGLRSAWRRRSGKVAVARRHRSKHTKVEPPSLAYGCGLLAEQLATRLGAERVRAVSTACCSNNTALSLSLSWLRRGLCDVVVCGGVDVLSPFCCQWFRSLRAQSADVCRPFDRTTQRQISGEASACVIWKPNRTRDGEVNRFWRFWPVPDFRKTRIT